MLVRMVKSPVGIIDGFDVGNLKVGWTYDLPTSLAGVLIVDEYAFAEMRVSQGQLPSDRQKKERSSDSQE